MKRRQFNQALAATAALSAVPPFPMCAPSRRS